MSRIFHPSLVYPSDSTGCFVDLEGEVLEVGEPIWDSYAVEVKTIHGGLTGFTERPPKVGDMATIRVYESGGGHYPDNVILGWVRNTKGEVL